ncbi:Pimeloyl-ACP methyl ester carboxylesterase [Lentzea californiensis]|nr:Pimeloyl-ACP methyl ester carboxylesterase [Lentzea californiensis]
MLGCLEPLFETRPGYRRLYPDLPAMGKSPADGVASSDDVLAAVEELVDAEIGDEPFLLVGESYGGYLYRALAHRRPHQVHGLALICPTGTKVRAADRTVPLFEVRRSDGAELDPALTAQCDGMAVARIEVRRELPAGPERGTYERPALFLTGRQDNITGYEDVYALLSHYPYASFVVLDTAGHDLQIEQPVLFNALMGDWLDRVAQ